MDGRGLPVPRPHGRLHPEPDDAARSAATQYACDITYGTNSEFGFDYLRDNGMAYRPEEQVQRGYYYAIIDEVDSILIDEARTPLIISGPAPYSTHQYYELKPPVERLVRRQRDLCNRLDAGGARSCSRRARTTRPQLKLYQVHQGMPKHKQLLHLLEEPAVRAACSSRSRSPMLTDMRKEEARELREELYFTIDEKGHDASLTEKGCEALSPNDPEAYVLPDLVSAMAELDGDTTLTDEQKFEKRQEMQNQFADRSERIHAVDQLIRAYCVYEKDVEYVVQDNQVLIVDEFTGRLMPGRRWSDGLHQAVEAKEGVKIERETQTLATITIQNYFRMYEKLAGMTGTAETEADEFHQIYKLDVVVIPTNRPVRRVDDNDLIYKTQREKYKAIIDEIADCHKRGQPVLVGTISVETSELISRMLQAREHPAQRAQRQEPRARSRDRLAAPARRARSPSPPTWPAAARTSSWARAWCTSPRDVITSRRPLDDKIDGKTLRKTLQEKPCGLHVIGSERHEARRIDRQLRGRCARQGDPGLVAVLRLARRRPDAAVRLRPDRRDHGAAGHRGRRGAGASVAEPVDRDGPAPRGAAELLHPQAHAGIRRRDEQAARDHLRLPRRGRRGAETCASSSTTCSRT